MVSDTLTDALIDEGQQLLVKLDKSGPSIEAAMWIRSEESGAWNLYFGIKSYSTIGPRVFYKSVQRAFSKDPKPLSLKQDHVRIAAPQDLGVAMLRQFAHIAGIARVSLTNNYFNGTRMPDALIYRTR